MVYEEMVDDREEKNPLEEEIEESENARKSLHRRILEETNKIIGMETEEIHHKEKMPEALTENGNALDAVARARIDQFLRLWEE
jgi:hypothetical protein